MYFISQNMNIKNDKVDIVIKWTWPSGLKGYIRKTPFWLVATSNGKQKSLNAYQTNTGIRIYENCNKEIELNM